MQFVHAHRVWYCFVDCPDGFRLLSGYSTSCYKLLTTRRNWYDGTNECTRLVKESHAVVIDNYEEDRAVAGYLMDQGKYGQYESVLYNVILQLCIITTLYNNNMSSLVARLQWFIYNISFMLLKHYFFSIA